MESISSKEAGRIPGKTWEEVFAARHGCKPAQFSQRIFWRTLHFHALFPAPLLLLGGHFRADFNLIATCGRARSLGAVVEELYTFRHDPRNTGWLRSRARIRISTRKLLQIARNDLKN
jgi:hypothetical protein